MAVAAHDQIHDPRHKNHGGNKIKRYALFGRVCKTCSNLVRSPVASFSASRLSAHRGPAIRSTMRTGSVRHLRQRTAPRDRAARPWQPNKQSRDGNLSRLGFFFLRHSVTPSIQALLRPSPVASHSAIATVGRPPGLVFPLLCSAESCGGVRRGRGENEGVLRRVLQERKVPM